MSEAITVKVTKTDIAKGNRNAGCACPIARALKRRLPKSTDIYVHPDIVCLWLRQRAQTSMKIAELPFPARTFVQRFDRGQPVEPFTFNLKF